MHPSSRHVAARQARMQAGRRVSGGGRGRQSHRLTAPPPQLGGAGMRQLSHAVDNWPGQVVRQRAAQAWVGRQIEKLQAPEGISGEPGGRNGGPRERVSLELNLGQRLGSRWREGGSKSGLKVERSGLTHSRRHAACNHGQERQRQRPQVAAAPRPPHLRISPGVWQGPNQVGVPQLRRQRAASTEAMLRRLHEGTPARPWRRVEHPRVGNDVWTAKAMQPPQCRCSPTHKKSAEVRVGGRQEVGQRPRQRAAINGPASARGQGREGQGQLAAGGRSAPTLTRRRGRAGGLAEATRQLTGPLGGGTRPLPIPEAASGWCQARGGQVWSG